MTRAQRAVLAALGDAAAFLSAQDLHARLRAAGESVGLTSVYRALQALSEQGAVDVVRTDGGELTYRRCASGGHHHHLRCRRCGATVEVEAPSLEDWVDQVARRHGFSNPSHTLEVTGTCAGCS